MAQGAGIAEKEDPAACTSDGMGGNKGMHKIQIRRHWHQM